jgi:hypothetical protein
VALAEIQHPYSWNNISDDIESDGMLANEIRLHDHSGSDDPSESRYSIFIRPGFYHDAEHLLAAIDRAKKHFIKNDDDLDFWSDACSFTWDNVHQRVELENRVDTTVQLSEALQYILGFRGKYFSGVNIAQYAPDLRAGMDSLYIYCDLCEPQIVGNSMEPLLRVLPVGGSYGSVIHRVFVAPHYVGLLKKEFSSVEISIKTDGNQNIPFAFGKTVAKLHFRRKRLYQI